MVAECECQCESVHKCPPIHKVQWGRINGKPQAIHVNLPAVQAMGHSAAALVILYKAACFIYI